MCVCGREREKIKLCCKYTCNAGDSSLILGSGRSAGEGIGYPLQYSCVSLVAQLVKNLPAMRETWVGKISWRTERLPNPVFWPGEFQGLYSPWGCKESDTTEGLSFSFSLSLSVRKEEKSRISASELSETCGIN